MVSRGRLILIVLSCAAWAPPAQADGSGRAAGVRACDADIHRLCQHVYPDEKLVASCLVRRRAELSRACAEILAHPPDEMDDIPDLDD